MNLTLSETPKQRRPYVKAIPCSPFCWNDVIRRFLKAFSIFFCRCWNVNKKDIYFWIIKGPILITILVCIILSSCVHFNTFSLY